MPAKPNFSVIIANDLRTGRCVYFTADSKWSETASNAELLNGENADTRLRAATEGERDNLVVDAYLIGLNESKTAIDVREQIRIDGPSILEMHPLLVAGSKAA